MTVPTPPMTLTGHCSAIYNNTLYVYTNDGFASIALEEKATWNKTLPQGVSVSGAACVSASVEGNNDDMAFYVVGGTGNSSSYPGLQRFSYQHQNWTKVWTGSGQLPNRTAHGVGYLESAGKMLMYGGSTSNGAASEDTFLISTTWPYEVTSQQSQGAPASANPMLLKWNESSVALIGGSEGYTGLYIYSDGPGFEASGSVLPTPVSSTSRCALAVDNDGNKILEEFDLSTSPNTVTSYDLMKDGQALNPATLANGTSSSKRSLSSYPSYNSTGAPTTKRSDYSVAQGKNLIVISGGSGSDSLSIFNQTTNSWTNATELFYGSSTQSALHGSTTTSSTTSTTPTATSSASATSTSAAAAAGSGDSGVDTGVIIGATLGSICGAIVILVLILFMLRRARLKREQSGQARGGDGKDRLSFQDQGIEPLRDGAYPMAKSPVPGAAAASSDSLAIMSGKYGYAGEKSLRPPSKNYGYGLSKNTQLSPIPSSGMAPSSMYSDDSDRSAAVAAAVEAISSPGNKPGDRTTDEGWGKYFDNNNATNLAGTQSDRSTISSVYTKSDYRGSGGWPMANLAPMNFGNLEQSKPLGRVASANPATETAGITGRNLIIPESQSARISSADSISLISDDDPHDTNWTGAAHSSWLGRPTSSNYSTSFYNSSNTNLPASNSNHQSGYARYSGARRSSVIIPEDIDELPPPGTMNSDMSWLNLHADR